MKKVRQLALIDMTALCDLLELEVKRHKTGKRKIPGMAALGHEGIIRTCTERVRTLGNMHTVDSWYLFFLDNSTMCSVYFIFLCLSVLTLCLWLWVNQVKAKKQTKKTTGTGTWLVVCCTSSAHTVSFLISAESSSCFPRIWMINKSNLRLFQFDVLVSRRLTR